MSRASSPAKAPRSNATRPAGGLEPAARARLFIERRRQVAEHKAALGPVYGRAADARRAAGRRAHYAKRQWLAVRRTAFLQRGYIIFIWYRQHLQSFGPRVRSLIVPYAISPGAPREQSRRRCNHPKMTDRISTRDAADPQSVRDVRIA